MSFFKSTCGCLLEAGSCLLDAGTFFLKNFGEIQFFCICGYQSTIMSIQPDYLKPINPLGDSELIVAGRNGDISKLQKIFQNSVDQHKNSPEIAKNIFAHHSNRLGKTVLHEAAQNSRDECVRYLVQKDGLGMDPDCLKQGDWTPLMLACTKDNLEVIRTLIEAGASLNLKNKDGWTPFHIACREGHPDIVEYFLRLESQQPWRTKSKNGRTPLHTASLYGRESVVCLLLSEKAFDSVDQADSCGSTPLMDALRGGHIDVARNFVQAGANPYTEDAVGRQPLHLTAQAGRDESLKFLVQLHIDIQRDLKAADFDERLAISNLVNFPTTDASRSMAVHFAAKEGHVHILTLLKSYGADLDASDSKGRTPLHMASSSQRTECVSYLLSEGVCDKPDDQGTLASDLAKKPEVKKIFEKYLSSIT